MNKICLKKFGEFCFSKTPTTFRYFAWLTSSRMYYVKSSAISCTLSYIPWKI